MNFDQVHLWHSVPIFLHHQVFPKEGWDFNSNSQLHFLFESYQFVTPHAFVMYCIKNHSSSFFFCFEQLHTTQMLFLTGALFCLFPNWILAHIQGFLFLNFLTINKTIVCLCICLMHPHLLKHTQKKKYFIVIFENLRVSKNISLPVSVSAGNTGQSFHSI